MTKFLRNANDFIPTSEAALNIYDKLPASNYIIEENPRTNELFFKEIEMFTVPDKLYGDVTLKAQRIITTFTARSGSTGVLLSGDKGSGKTLLAKLLSVLGYSLGLPTILVNSNWRGDKFNKLIQDVNQHAIILFDEFEKVYERKHQEAILTLLDGVFPTKKLFMFTCNDNTKLDQNMHNRPGRIYYSLDYSGLSDEFIKEYCTDNLDDKSHIDRIIAIASTFGDFNFDIMKAMVEEMNRYKESPFDTLKMLNASPMHTGRGDVRYKMDIKVVNGPATELENNYTYNDTLNLCPLSVNDMKIGYKIGEEEHDFTLEREMLIKFDATNGSYIYRGPSGEILTFSKMEPVAFNLEKLLMG